jgi:hypothetical protein
VTDHKAAVTGRDPLLAKGGDASDDLMIRLKTLGLTSLCEIAGPTPLKLRKSQTFPSPDIGFD